MKVRRGLKLLRQKCTHWFIPTSMSQTGKEMTGRFDMPVYTPVYSIGGAVCCVCGTTSYDLARKLMGLKRVVSNKLKKGK